MMAQGGNDTPGPGLPPASFPLRHRLFRAVWRASWLLLAAWTPPPLHAWRCLLLRAFGARIGPGARVYGSADIWYPPNLTLGRNAVIGWRVDVYCQGPITLGDGAVVSQFVHLLAGTHDIDRRGFPLVTKPIHIGAAAWVAAGAIVGPGVTVGEGAVLGAGSVAFSDLDPWTVYTGNPARPRRRRSRPGITGGT
jgi:putative colanic acid biosynthesis acetyltransferase WcaF